MQLLEYFMWSDQSCSGSNQLANRIGLTLITLQPVCSLLSQRPYLATPKLSYLPLSITHWSQQIFSITVLKLYCVFTIVSLLKHFALPNTNRCWCSIPSSEPGENHLVWTWINYHPIADYLQAAMYYSMCFLPIFASGQWITGTMYAGTLLYSMINHAATGGWSSVWCFLVNARSMGYLMGF